ncbi:MTRF1L release factor glutamine methyltransferase-like [Saccostrea echinata]|uniref:MTRF1L release factor glutamine methyltransferase-like n=1 Tax=Saccostrea echinata TaxID=191078 RepID=UPI002A8165E3|nr:MTRF1L release factor glutamine methyltransferase-like [Saccostrea echinata]
MRWLLKLRKKDFHIVRRNLNRHHSCSANSSDVNSVCSELSRKLQNVGIEREESNLSAEYIIAHVLGKKMFHQVSKKQIITETQLARIKQLAMRRLERMPIQYVIQEWDFHEFTIKLCPPVLIPRPETEELVQYVIQDVEESRTCQKFLEVGCGSGAVTLCLLAKLPWMAAVACDINDVACHLTVENLTRYKVQGRANVLNVDFKSQENIQLISRLGPFDFIISNPPYIPTADIDDLDPEVKRYEDRQALDGGQDGLDFVRRLISVAPMLLKKEGKLWLETGLEQHKKIKDFIHDNSAKELEFIKSLVDFKDRERFCLIQKR